MYEMTNDRERRFKRTLMEAFPADAANAAAITHYRRPSKTLRNLALLAAILAAIVVLTL
jgi:hypothetical protein